MEFLGVWPGEELNEAVALDKRNWPQAARKDWRRSLPDVLQEEIEPVKGHRVHVKHLNMGHAVAHR
jgi:hypothetical protein